MRKRPAGSCQPVRPSRPLGPGGAAAFPAASLTTKPQAATPINRGEASPSPTPAASSTHLGHLPSPGAPGATIGPQRSCPRGPTGAVDVGARPCVSGAIGSAHSAAVTRPRDRPLMLLGEPRRRNSTGSQRRALAAATTSSACRRMWGNRRRRRSASRSSGSGGAVGTPGSGRRRSWFERRVHSAASSPASSSGSPVHCPGRPAAGACPTPPVNESQTHTTLARAQAQSVSRAGRCTCRTANGGGGTPTCAECGAVGCVLMG